MAQLEDPEKKMLENLAKREDQSDPNVPHQQANIGNQFPQPKKPKTVLYCNEHGDLQAHFQQPVAHKGPNYLRSGIAHQGYFQQPNAGNQVPPSKELYGRVIDCNEVAKLYGGVVFIDYDSMNKFPGLAYRDYCRIRKLPFS